MKTLLLLTAVSLLAGASAKTVSYSDTKYSGNFSIAFLPDDQGSACDANDLSKAIVLTTNSSMTMGVCFNVTDIFSQPNDTGYAKPQPPNTDRGPDGEPPQRNGIDWTLEHRKLHDPKANYSRVWHEQVNVGEEPGGDKPAPWSLTTFPYAGCAATAEWVEEMGPDAEGRLKYGGNCPTEAGGECERVPYSVKSFWIVSEEALGTEDDEECRPWGSAAGAASRTGGPASMFSVASVGVMALFLLM